MSYSILVADDAKDDITLLDYHLKPCYRIVTLIKARNGIEATEHSLLGLQPNLIILNVNMPPMDGYEVLL